MTIMYYTEHQSTTSKAAHNRGSNVHTPSPGMAGGFKVDLGWEASKAMKMPYFLRLAEIDKQHFISACRHGLVHITWGRITLRLTRDEFRELAGMLLRATDDLPPTSIRSGDLSVAYRTDEDCELRIGLLALLLSPAEFEQFAQVAHEAAHHLDKILRSGAWDKEEPEDQHPDDSLEPIRRNPFSRN